MASFDWISSYIDARDTLDVSCPLLHSGGKVKYCRVCYGGVAGSPVKKAQQQMYLVGVGWHHPFIIGLILRIDKVFSFLPLHIGAPVEAQARTSNKNMAIHQIKTKTLTVNY